MNHISTLTVTQQYIQNQVEKVTQQNSDDILQVISAAMAAIDERFKANELNIKAVQKHVQQHLTQKDKDIGKNLRH